MKYPDDILSDDRQNTFDLIDEDTLTLPEIIEKIKALQDSDSGFNNPRVNNLRDDIESLQKDVRELLDDDVDVTWPAEFFQRYFDVIKTTKRLGIM